MAIALAFMDPGEPGGPLQATATGFRWTWACAYREPTTNVKTIVSGIVATTLDGDSLVQVRDKIAAAIKADAADRGFAVTTVLLPTFQVVAV